MKDLVLIPGLGSDETVWTRTIVALGEAVHCTVGDTLQDRSLSEMARRILADAPERFVLAGVSMGGMVALEIIRAEPDRVAALALIDSNAFPDTAQQAEQRARTIEAVRAGVDMRSAGEASLGWLVHPQASDSVKQEIVAMGIRLGAEIYGRQNEAVLHRPDQRQVLGEIKVPTVVMHGANDAMIPISRASEIATAIAGATLDIIPDCGHLPPIEKPEVVAHHLRTLCQGAAKPKT